eukprot:CAMPEP_0197516666 /NCGR_PEP_ID=MMETSP1318-20131121/1561_1 /TAXON_ID=552666 /ORGANISM="Partenskyella glossopodia, Strain RCC365" /LENGTH=454 /DNA_ID=CAMNT_0043065569 /DNA_START=32 /DNA_END=1396 /DNA_ORIENTATION=-
MRTILLLLAIFCLQAQSQLVLESVERQIDLRDAAERIRSLVVVRNDGPSQESEMIVAIPEAKRFNVSFVKVTESKKKLFVDKIDEFGPNGEPLYKVTFSKPLKPQKTKKLTIFYGFMGVFVPYPSENRQNDPHLVKYTANLYETSPYPVKKQTTMIKTSTANIVSYTKAKPHSQKGEKTTYGPYTDQSPYAFKALSLHFETKAKFMTVTHLEREIKVCHWGGVVFSEVYNLRNSGADLKDTFHRIDYENMQFGTSFHDLSAKLPKNSYGIDFRDDIGNISSSHVRETSKHVLFEMTPRFPLFGGWKSIFNLYYTVPIMQLVSSVAGTSSYILNTTFSTPFEGLYTESAIVKVVLPEGSSNIKWVTPFPIESVDTEILKTYLDLTGRPVLVLEARNLMRYHNQNFQVWYSYPNIMIHRGPLFVMIGFMAFFGFVIFTSRVDITIGTATAKKTKSD